MSQLSRSLAWMTALQLISVGVSFASQVLIARTLTPGIAGIYVAALAAYGVISILQSAGLEAYIIRHPSPTREHAHIVFTLSLLLALAIALVTFTAATFGEFLLGSAQVAQALYWLTPVPILGCFALVPLANMERAGDFREVSISNFSATIATAVTTIALLGLGIGYMSVIYAQSVGAIVLSALSLIFGRNVGAPRLRLRGARDVMRFGAQMLTVSGVSNLALRMSDLIVGRALGLDALALFNRANALNGLFWNNLHLVVGRVLFSDFAAAVRSGEPLRERYLSSLRGMTGLLWPLFGGLAIISGPLVSFVYGPAWSSAAPLVSLLAVSSILQLSVTLTWELFAATNRLREQTRIEIIRAAYGMALIGGASLIGLVFVGLARAIESAISTMVYRHHIRSMAGLEVGDLAGVYRQSALLTLIAIIPATVVMGLYGWSPGTPLLPLLTSVAIGVVLWTVLLVASRHPILSFVGDRRLFRRR